MIIFVHRCPTHDQQLLHHMGHQIKGIRKADRRPCVEKSVLSIKNILNSDTPLVKNACNSMKGCYKEATYRALPSSQLYIKRITEERVSLYQHVPPVRENILVPVDPSPLDDSILYKENI